MVAPTGIPGPGIQARCHPAKSPLVFMFWAGRGTMSTNSTLGARSSRICLVIINEFLGAKQCPQQVLEDFFAGFILLEERVAQH